MTKTKTKKLIVTFDKGLHSFEIDTKEIHELYILEIETEIANELYHNRSEEIQTTKTTKTPVKTW